MRLTEVNRLRLLYFLILSCTASWLPLFADNLKSRGLSGIQIGIILSVTPISMFLVQPFVGMLADRWGFRRSMMVYSLMATIAFFLLQLDASFGMLVVMTVFMSVFYNGLQPVMDSLTLQLTQRDPTFSYGIVRLAGAAGWAVTGIVIGYFIDALDTRVIFMYSGASLLLVFFLSTTIPHDYTKEKSTEGFSFGSALREIVTPSLLVILMAFFLVSAAATTIWNFYSIYMKENGASASLVGVGLSLQGLCEIPFFYFSDAIIRRIGLRNTLLLTTAATALRLLLYSLVNVPEMALPIEILHGLSWSLFWVAGVEYTNRLVAVRWRATGQSLLYAAYFGIGQITGNFWTGFLYDQHLPIASIFFLNFFVVALIVVLLAFTVKSVQRPVTL
jgi:PPP family 3-phenylpropionic acid transporter